jgi:MATE family multidrug resistance protein
MCRPAHVDASTESSTHEAAVGQESAGSTRAAVGPSGLGQESGSGTRAAVGPSGLHSLTAELAAIFKLAWPQSTTQLTSFAPGLVLLAAIGHLDNGAVLVGAAGVASMYSNVAHKMLLVSTTFGVTPLFSQAFGADNHVRIGRVFMRVLVLHVLLALCVSLPMTAAASFLFTAFGLPGAVVEPAQTFLWVRLLGVPGTILWFDTQMFLQSQRCVKLPMTVMLTGAVVQTVLVSALSAPSALGYVGAPLALTLVELGQGIVLLAMTPLLLRRYKLRSWPAWRRDVREACKGWGEIITRGGPACVLVMSEWFGWECTLFVASGLCAPSTDVSGEGLDDLAVGAGSHSNISFAVGASAQHNVSHDAPSAGEAGCPIIEAIPICTSIFICQFLIAFGPGLAANVRVGNLLGEGHPKDAKYCATVAFGMAMAVQATVSATLISLRSPIVGAFVDDPDVRAHAIALLPYTTTYSFLATAVSGFSQQLLFAVGAKLAFPATLNLFAFFAVGVPVGALLGYQGGLEERGIWLGLVLAMLVAFVGQYAYIFKVVDWDAASKRARERALQEGTGEGAESDGRGLAAADSAGKEMAGL